MTALCTPSHTSYLSQASHAVSVENKSVMWRNFRFLCMTVVEKFELSLQLSQATNRDLDILHLIWRSQKPEISKCPLGKPSFKKKQNFMKKFQKTVTPSPLYCFYEILIQKFDRISGTYVFLNNRYEIQLTPPPPVCKKIS